MTNKTRLFFVVDSKTENEEIFETLEEANDWFEKLAREFSPRLYIGIVKNAHKEKGRWNYEDLADTFEVVKTLR